MTRLRIKPHNFQDSKAAALQTESLRPVSQIQSTVGLFLHQFFIQNAGV